MTFPILLGYRYLLIRHEQNLGNDVVRSSSKCVELVVGVDVTSYLSSSDEFSEAECPVGNIFKWGPLGFPASETIKKNDCSCGVGSGQQYACLWTGACGKPK
jgi:hypothetical protein